MKYRLLLAYDGTEYGGWQIQKNASSIQEEIEKALSTLLRTEIRIVGSGRTDAGVHARGQIAHFICQQTLNTFRINYALNALLPKAIRSLEMVEVDDSFHARYSAQRKIYHYHLYLHSILDPFRGRYVYHLPYRIDLKRLQEGIPFFLGTHDFTAFANESHAGPCARNPVRTLYRIDLCQEEGGIRLEFEGNGFLYRMVRNIVSTLLEVGSGKKEPRAILTLFEGKSRAAVGMAAPPQGLFLHKVIYDPSK